MASARRMGEEQRERSGRGCDDLPWRYSSTRLLALAAMLGARQGKFGGAGSPPPMPFHWLKACESCESSAGWFPFGKGSLLG